MPELDVTVPFIITSTGASQRQQHWRVLARLAEIEKATRKIENNKMTERLRVICSFLAATRFRWRC